MGSFSPHVAEPAKLVPEGLLKDLLTSLEIPFSPPVKC